LRISPRFLIPNSSFIFPAFRCSMDLRDSRTCPSIDEARSQQSGGYGSDGELNFSDSVGCIRNHSAVAIFGGSTRHGIFRPGTQFPPAKSPCSPPHPSRCLTFLAVQTDHPSNHWPFHPPYPLTSGLQELMLSLRLAETIAPSRAIPRRRQPKLLDRVRGSIILEPGNMRREDSPSTHPEISLPRHVSIRSFSIANWS